MTQLTTTIKIDTSEAQKYWQKAMEEASFNYSLYQEYAPKVGLNALYSDVKKFHVAFNHPAPDKPTMLSKERIAARAKWTREEVQEMEDAETIVDVADACIDQIYFAVGTLVELGIEPQALWNIVQAANMAKLGPDGKPLYHPDGKTRKPEGWQPPEPKLKAEVERQLANAA